MGEGARYIRWLDEITINDVPLVGGKNASLGVLYRELAPKGVRVPKDSVVVVVNLTIQSRDRYVIGFPRKGLWHTRFNSDSYNYGPDFANHAAPNVETREEEADGLPCCGEICIGPYTDILERSKLASESRWCKSQLSRDSWDSTKRLDPEEMALAVGSCVMCAHRVANNLAGKVLDPVRANPRQVC